MLLDLDYIKTEFGRHLLEHQNQKWGMDSALFYVVKLVYEQGVKDGIESAKKSTEGN